MATHYETLGVSPSAEPEVLQGAYRALMRKYHPDTNKGAYSEARAKRINEAYATLSNPGLRAVYDAELRAAQAAPRWETAGQGAASSGAAEDFARTKPAPETDWDKVFRDQADQNKPGLNWRIHALATVGVAVIGLVAGRMVTSAPPPAAKVAFDSGPAQPPPATPPTDATDHSPAAGVKAARAGSADRAIAAIVQNDIVPRWRPDCSAGNVSVDVQVNLAPNGSLVDARVADGAGDPAPLRVAMERARQAVIQAAPFDVPRASHGQGWAFIVRFDTRDVCPRSDRAGLEGRAG